VSYLFMKSFKLAMVRVLRNQLQNKKGPIDSIHLSPLLLPSLHPITALDKSMQF
jgi:hypothetical protein